MTTPGTRPSTGTKGKHYATDILSVPLLLRNRPGSLMVVHAFAEKAKQDIRDRQQKKAKQAKEERVPALEAQAGDYLDAAGRECVPVMVIKKAFISAATAFDDLTKISLRQALFVLPTHDQASQLVPIKLPTGGYAVGEMREDAVTIVIS